MAQAMGIRDTRPGEKLGRTRGGLCISISGLGEEAGILPDAGHPITLTYQASLGFRVSGLGLRVKGMGFAEACHPRAGPKNKKLGFQVAFNAKP